MIGDTNTKWGHMFLLLANLLGCAPQPYYYHGFNLWSIEFVLISPEQGIYPNTDILSDPNNPFSQPLFDDKWEIEAFGYPPASYYAWATQLAVEPIGENQFYTAQALTNMYTLDLVDAHEKFYVWDMAVRAHEAVLLHFPDSVSYLADGVSSFSLAPLSYQALVDLGADVSNWQITTLDNGTIVMQGGS